MNSKLVSSYTVDTLQIYFPWDDDFYTHFKNLGFGQKGLKRKAMPLIYTDNCESTTSVKKRSRKYVINPSYFGETFQSLGWEETTRKTEPIISAEKPQIQISLENNDADLVFKIMPRVDGEEQYHLEYSSMAAFGSMYSNWSIVVLPIENFSDLIDKLNDVGLNEREWVDVPIHKESKQAQREQLVYVEIPIKSYKFSIGEFIYAKKYFELNGITCKLPSLVFENNEQDNKTMDPILKLGFIHTKSTDGFEERKPQCALKIAQPKVTLSQRGKKAKKKGSIKILENYTNQFVVPAKKFLVYANALKNADPLKNNK